MLAAILPWWIARCMWNTKPALAASTPAIATCLQAAAVSEVEKMAREEARGGNVGVGTREVQTMNYIRGEELKRQRTEIFQDGLDLFYKDKHREALELFEKCIGLEPY